MTIEKNKSSKKRIRKNKSHKVLEKEEIYGGEAYIFRTESGGKFWSISFWIPEEKKEYRRSLKTKNKIDALQKAKDEFLTVKGKIKSGVKIWDITVETLIEEYLEKQNEAAEAALKTKGRVGTIRSQLKHFASFVGLKTKLYDIDPNIFVDYVPYRTKTAAAKYVTLNNEKATIRNLLTFAKKRGYIELDVDWDFGRIPNVVGKRKAIKDSDRRKITNYTKHWEKGEDDPKVIEQKRFIRYFILILGNTGLRFGECRKLQWKDVNIEIKINRQKDNKKEKIIWGHLPPLKTKNRKERNFVGRYGEALERIKEFSKWTKDDDLIFVDNESGKPIDKKVYYKYWKEIIEATNVDKDYSYYGLRHMLSLIHI